MELNQKRIEQLNKQPIIQTIVKKSEDGKWILHKTIITDIKPTKYYEEVMKDKESNKGSE